MRCCIIVMQPRQRGRCVCSNLISFDLCPIISRGFLTTPLSLCLVVSFSLSCSLFFSVSLSLFPPLFSRHLTLSLSSVGYTTQQASTVTHKRGRAIQGTFFCKPESKILFSFVYNLFTVRILKDIRRYQFTKRISTFLIGLFTFQ